MSQPEQEIVDQLFAACGERPPSLAKIRSLVQKSPQAVRAKNNYGSLPLHWACYGQASEPVVRLLVEQYPEAVRAKDKYGDLPLHLACRYGASEEVVRLLVEQYPAAVRAKTNNGWLPLHLACRNKASEEVIRFLVEQYPESIRVKDEDGDLPLHLACGGGASEEVVRFLVEQYPESIRAKNNDGKTPIDRAKAPLYGKAVNPQVVTWLEDVAAGRVDPLVPLFCTKLCNIANVVEETADGELVSVSELLRETIPHMRDFLQLKYFYTAVNAYYRLQVVNESERARLLQQALEKAKTFCIDSYHGAMYGLALERAKTEGIIDDFDLRRLGYDAIKELIWNADYIQDMRQLILNNTARIDRVESNVESLCQATCEAFEQFSAAFQQVQGDMRSLHEAVNEQQSNLIRVNTSLNQVRAGIRMKQRVSAAGSFVSGILNAVSWGAAGSMLQGVFECALCRIVDFGDIVNVTEAFGFASERLSASSFDAVGNMTIKESLDHGISLAVDMLDERQLEKAAHQKNTMVVEQNAVVVVAAYARMFTITSSSDDVADAAGLNLLPESFADAQQELETVGETSPQPAEMSQPDGLVEMAEAVDSPFAFVDGDPLKSREWKEIHEAIEELADTENERGLVADKYIMDQGEHSHGGQRNFLNLVNCSIIKKKEADAQGGDGTQEAVNYFLRGAGRVSKYMDAQQELETVGETSPQPAEMSQPDGLVEMAEAVDSPFAFVDGDPLKSREWKEIHEAIEELADTEDETALVADKYIMDEGENSHGGQRNFLKLVNRSIMKKKEVEAQGGDGTQEAVNFFLRGAGRVSKYTAGQASS